MQSLIGKVTGDSLSATEWNQLPGEVQNVIESLGITLSSGDLNQLGKAIAGYVANGTFYTDSGVADAYVLTQVGSKKAAPAYTDGFTVVFRPGNTNTGASTVNIAGLGVKSIKDSTGADPAAGLIVAGELISMYYDAVNGWFTLVPMLGFVTPSELAAMTGFRGLSGSADGISAGLSFTIDEVVLVNASGAPVKRTGVSLSINTATTGANGLDTGTLAASTWYYIYAIWNGTTVAGLISLSPTAPTLPSGYTYWCRIGSTITDGTANKYPLSMRWEEKHAQYVVNASTNVPATILLASGVAGSVTTPTYVAVSVSSYLPPVAKTIFAQLTAYGQGISMMLAPNNNYGSNSSSNAAPIVCGAPSSTGNAPMGNYGELVLESTNVYWASSTSTCRLAVYGWRE